MSHTEKKQTMEINEIKLIRISRDEIYANYVKYIEPIIDYMYDNFGIIKGSSGISEFIDNTAINGYGFIDYNGNLYIAELMDDEEQLKYYDYFITGKDKYILIPVE